VPDSGREQNSGHSHPQPTGRLGVGGGAAGGSGWVHAVAAYGLAVTLVKVAVLSTVLETLQTGSPM